MKTDAVRRGESIDLQSACGPSQLLRSEQDVSVREVNVGTNEEARLTCTHVPEHELFPDRSICFVANFFRRSSDDLMDGIQKTQSETR
jgi:hypothetical protein